MALIKCNDCGRDVSDSASACVGCGAPTPKRVDPNQTTCPYCATPISIQAEVCPACKAEKGFVYHHFFGVLGRQGLIFTGLVFPLAIIIGLYQITQGAIFQVVAVILGILMAIDGFKLLGSPKWFRRKL